MKIRMIKNDIMKHKSISLVLFVFILLAALLAASAGGTAVELVQGMENLFADTKAPHFVQMHRGEIDKESIGLFAAENPDADQWQVVDMLNINGANIYLGDNEASEAGSVMENSFVVQNEQFDFLLNLDGQVAAVSQGEIGVPVYHMQKYGLAMGDSVGIVKDGYSKIFTITAFIRDVQMNPSIVSSKRFLVHPADWESLHENLGEMEYLISFRLKDLNSVNRFANAYAASGLPQKDTTLTYTLYRLLNSLTDGIVVAIIVLISLLLIAVAGLCLRYTILTALEEDYREIGVLKAIGISSRDTSKLYLLKYVALSAAGCVGGFLLSFVTGHIFTGNISLYMGQSAVTAQKFLLSFLGVFLVFLFVLLLCMAVLRKLHRVSPVEALRSGSAGQLGGNGGPRRFLLSRTRFRDLNLFLGVRAVFVRFRAYGLLCFVFILCAFLMILPVQFQNTIRSPGFISYMGAGKSDIRVDLQHTADAARRFQELTAYVAQDPDVERYAAFVTGHYQVRHPDGTLENIKVETGDFSVFPLLYSSGGAPEKEGQIALSAMLADELEKSVGNTLTLVMAGQTQVVTVSGIYQDATNGGKTAKAVFSQDFSPVGGNVLWYVVNLDLKDNVHLADKAGQLGAMFYPAKVTDMDDYVAQTMGSVLSQLGMVVGAATVLSLCIAVLVTALFFKMQLAKDAKQIAIMRSLGFSLGDIRKQYIARALVVLLVGILAGTLAVGVIGQSMAGLLLSGVPNLKFIVNPFVAYVLCPLSLVLAVTGTVFAGSLAAGKINIMLLTGE